MIDNQYIQSSDWLLVIVYLVGIYFFAKKLRNHWYPAGHPFRVHFLMALFIKIFGAIFLCLFYQYHYDGLGDTFSYFKVAQIQRELFPKHPWRYLNILLGTAPWYDSNYIQYISRIPDYALTNNLYVSSVASVLSIFSFNRFLITSILFAVLSFTGVWALFRTFARQFPDLIPYVALATLYVPSLAIWGSGIFKDTLCLFALGWLTFSTFQMLVYFKFSYKNIFMAALSLLLLALIKIYILLAFVPAVSFWIFANNIQQLKNPLIKGVLRIGLPLVIIGALVWFNSQFQESLGGYSLQRVFETSEDLRRNIIIINEMVDGSGYDLGPIKPYNLYGLVLKAPLAINVTLFRPYIWESSKLIMLLNAFESFIYLLLTLYVLFRVGLLHFISALGSSPHVQFFLLFTLTFAFAIGISTYNFGTLSRYRIPCLPFYGMALVVLYFRFGPGRWQRKSKGLVQVY